MDIYLKKGLLKKEQIKWDLPQYYSLFEGTLFDMALNHQLIEKPDNKFYENSKEGLDLRLGRNIPHDIKQKLGFYLSEHNLFDEKELYDQLMNGKIIISKNYCKNQVKLYREFNYSGLEDLISIMEEHEDDDFKMIVVEK
jgi:hypothetical protein